MKEETEPPEMAVSHCPSCDTLLVRGQVIKGGLLQCSRCKKYWIVNMIPSNVSIVESPPRYMRY